MVARGAGLRCRPACLEREGRAAKQQAATSVAVALLHGLAAQSEFAFKLL